MGAEVSSERCRLDREVRRILFVYPKFPPTFLSLQYCLGLIGKRSHLPPLGLLTIAAMTPPQYEMRVVDLNCGPLRVEDLEWSDLVCFSVMLTQQNSFFEAASRCRAADRTVVAGGPYPTTCPDECMEHVDVLVLDEGEVTWPRFLDDLQHRDLSRMYRSDEKPDLSLSPTPRFDLLRIDDYASIAVQYSRGCPHDCEFCDIVVLFGRRPRTKPTPRFLDELQALDDLGYRGPVNVVDDNVICSKPAIRQLLPELRKWQQEHGEPFQFSSQVSIDLAQDEELLREMVAAGFRGALIGLETPSEEALRETGKRTNLKEPILSSVLRLQSSGFLPSAGFIIGFDCDGPDIFDRQIRFIQEAAIPMAMVGLLVALPGTRLYQRLRDEGRLVDWDFSQGDHFVSTNVDTILPRSDLLAGYRRVLQTVYAPDAYFERCHTALARLPRVHRRKDSRRDRTRVRRTSSTPKRDLQTLLSDSRDFLHSVSPEYRRKAVRFLFRVALTIPRHLLRALFFAVVGVHFHRYVHEVALPALERQQQEGTG